MFTKLVSWASRCCHFPHLQLLMSGQKETGRFHILAAPSYISHKHALPYISVCKGNLGGAVHLPLTPVPLVQELPLATVRTPAVEVAVGDLSFIEVAVGELVDPLADDAPVSK